MTIATIKQQQDAIVVSGDLNFASVVALWNESLPLLAQQQRALHFDFSAVSSSNSAGLALMLEWFKYARQKNKSIRFQHVPQQLLSIMAVSGVRSLLDGIVQ